MLDEQRSGRDLKNFVLPELGQLLKTGDPWEPYRVLDGRGRPVESAALYLKELRARNSSPLTPRSYGMDLLRWFRFLWALAIEWDRATREDARDFMLWMKVADKPKRIRIEELLELGLTASSATSSPPPGRPFRSCRSPRRRRTKSDLSWSRRSWRTC
ncbi:site-specific integrase [Streptomyces sp. NPDC054987]